MNTTSLIIEYLVAGILLLFAFLLLAYSLCPQDIQTLFLLLKSIKEFDFAILSLFTAIAYALGVLSEPIARIIFEYPVHDLIKRRRLRKYIERHKGSLDKSALLKKYITKDNKIPNIKLKEAKEIIGEMRFYVLKQNSELYKEIESQINRLRLIRILFIVEIVLLLAFIFQITNSFSPSLCFGIILIGIFCACTVIGIINRLNRYGRAIERSYELLVF